MSASSLARVLVLVVLSVSGCRITPAMTELPADLPAGADAWAVTGHNVRYSGAPVTFGPYATPVVRGSGAPTTWVLGGHHVGFGMQARRYGFQLDRERQPLFGLGCGSNLAFLRLQDERGHIDIEDPRDVPALACDIWPADSSPGSPPVGALVLWYRGRDLMGIVDTPAGRIDISTTRRIQDVPMPMGSPVAYRMTRNGRLLAHVDLLQGGTVRMLPGVAQGDRDWLAAAATALLIRTD